MKHINKILLIDDDPISNFITHKLLLKMEVAEEIKVCSGGEEAIAYLDQTKELPNLILFDLNMPGMNGFEFLNAFNRQFSAYKEQVKLVALTTSGNKEDLRKLVLNNIVRLSKPLKVISFYKILKKRKLFDPACSGRYTQGKASAR